MEKKHKILNIIIDDYMLHKLSMSLLTPFTEKNSNLFYIILSLCLLMVREILDIVKLYSSVLVSDDWNRRF